MADSAPFGWTPEAAETLLRLRYITMKLQFQEGSSRKRAEAWRLLAAATSRVSGLQVEPKQCKSKLKHMQKQYKNYQEQDAQGHLTEPLCYETMCEVWGQQDETRSNRSSSDEATTNALSPVPDAEETVEESGSEQDEQQSEAETIDDAAQADPASSSEERRHLGKRSREPDQMAEGMMAIAAGLHEIAEAIRESRSAQRAENQQAEIVRSVRELSRAMMAQNQAFNNLLQCLAAANPSASN